MKKENLELKKAFLVGVIKFASNDIETLKVSKKLCDSYKHGIPVINTKAYCILKENQEIFDMLSINFVVDTIFNTLCSLTNDKKKLMCYYADHGKY